MFLCGALQQSYSGTPQAEVPRRSAVVASAASCRREGEVSVYVCVHACVCGGGRVETRSCNSKGIVCRFLWGPASREKLIPHSVTSFHPSCWPHQRTQVVWLGREAERSPLACVHSVQVDAGSLRNAPECPRCRWTLRKTPLPVSAVDGEAHMTQHTGGREGVRSGRQVSTQLCIRTTRGAL